MEKKLLTYFVFAGLNEGHCQRVILLKDFENKLARKCQQAFR